MKAKNEYYKNYVDGRIRIRKLIYILIFLITFCLVLYDSFIYVLPFHYILFFLIGKLMSLLLKRTQKVEWREVDGKYTVKRNNLGTLTIITIIFLRIFLFSKILTEFNVIFISDALLLVSIGWFIGRVNMLSDAIEDKAFSSFMKNGDSKQSHTEFKTRRFL